MNGIIVDNWQRQEIVVYSETFTKDAKSKVRTFYKHFYQLVKKFVDEVDLLSEEVQKDYSEKPSKVISELKSLWEKEKAEKEEAERKLLNQSSAPQPARRSVVFLGANDQKNKEVIDDSDADFEDKDVVKMSSP